MQLCVQRSGMGGVLGKDVRGGDDASEQRRGVPQPAQPARRDREESPGWHGKAGAPAGHHLHVAAEEGRPHYQVQRGHPGWGLHPLVRRRRTRHLEHSLLLCSCRREFTTVLIGDSMCS